MRLHGCSPSSRAVLEDGEKDWTHPAEVQDGDLAESKLAETVPRPAGQSSATLGCGCLATEFRSTLFRFLGQFLKTSVAAAL